MLKPFNIITSSTSKSVCKKLKKKKRLRDEDSLFVLHTNPNLSS